MITKYKNNFPEVEAFLWDGDIEKAKEFFGVRFGEQFQVKNIEGNNCLIMGLATDPWTDAIIYPGCYIVRLNEQGACIKLGTYDFTGQYTKI